MNSLLLSVCVPTYNGDNHIELCLESLVKAFKNNSDVEIIISDNCSSDNTPELLKKYSEYANFRIYKNNTNLGFTGNVNILLNKYARGKYCWIIGDDDLVDPDVFKLLEPLLRQDYPFFSICHRVVKPKELKNLRDFGNREAHFCVGSYFECIDKIVKDSNILGTFMSSQLYLHDRVKSFNLSALSTLDWSDFRTIFPNSYMVMKTFQNDGNCCCITTPLISALSHSKSWDDKKYHINMKVLPDYYSYCRKQKGGKKLIKTNQIIKEGIFAQNVYEIIGLRWRKVKWEYVFKMAFFRFIVKRIINRIQRLF